MQEDYCSVNIENRKVLISNVDEERILQHIDKLTMKELPKFIFGLSKLNGKQLKIYHKNGNETDFRRSNLILTNISFIKKLSKVAPYKGYIDVADNIYYHSIGVHLDPYSNEYCVIQFDNKGRYVYEYDKSIGEAILLFNKHKDYTLEQIKLMKG